MSGNQPEPPAIGVVRLQGTHSIHERTGASDARARLPRVDRLRAAGDRSLKRNALLPDLPLHGDAVPADRASGQSFEREFIVHVGSSQDKERIAIRNRSIIGGFHSVSV